MKSDGSQDADQVREYFTRSVPFLKKDAIADLVRQLDLTRKNLEDESVHNTSNEGDSHVQMLSLRALDGKTVELENELGTVWPVASQESMLRECRKSDAEVK